MKKIIFLILLLTPLFYNAQPKLNRLTFLPDVLKETSALVILDSLFWTINDSGNKNILYAFNIHGKIVRKVVVNNSTNNDWEALAADTSYLYIGDFGNNRGNRRNLVIYAVPLDSLSQSAVTPAFSIAYSYPEQKAWIRLPMNTPFDCEAMIPYENRLHLFTKDWKKGIGAHYTLPVKKGTHQAELQNYLNARGLITDATLNNKNLWLIGYYHYNPVIWRYNIDQPDKPLLRAELPQFRKYQVEGIAIQHDTLYITSEDSETEQALFYVPVSELE